ncbi:MAG: alpha/beta fold hydrolase [Thermomicrobiales bacterium]
MTEIFPAPAPVTTVVSSRDGTPIAVDRYGDGAHPSLVICSGAMVTKGAEAGFAASVCDRFTVHAYDRRGREDSGDTAPYAVEREIEDLAAVIAHAGTPAAVLGHSSGAVLALRAAAHGVPMAKLAVYEPPFIVDDGHAPLPDDYVAHLETLIAEGKRVDAVAYFMTAAVGMPEDMVDGMRAAGHLDPMAGVAHTLSYDGRIMGDTMSGTPLAAEPWRRVTVPVLVMAGGASGEYMRTGARQLVERLPDARLEILEGQDHGPADDALGAAISGFLLG